MCSDASCRLTLRLCAFLQSLQGQRLTCFFMLRGALGARRALCSATAAHLPPVLTGSMNCLILPPGRAMGARRRISFAPAVHTPPVLTRTASCLTLPQCKALRSWKHLYAPEAARLPLALAGPMSRLIFHYAEHWVCPEALKFVPGFAHSSGMDKADILSDSSLKQGAVCPETLIISAGYAPYSGLSRAYIWSGS